MRSFVNVTLTRGDISFLQEVLDFVGEIVEAAEEDFAFEEDDRVVVD